MVSVSQVQLDAIWEALNTPAKIHHPDRARAILSDAVQKGWLRHHQLEDFIYESDHRLDELNYKIGLQELAITLGFRWTHITTRPLLASNSATYSDALSSPEAAAFLIDLERLGFQVDPTPIIEQLRPNLLKKEILTEDEMNVFWYPKFREKSETALVVTDDSSNFGEIREGKFANGYRYSAWLRRNGEIFSLTVNGPRYRRRKPPAETICAKCGYTWWRGDPTSSYVHRREHRKRMRVLAPERDARAFAELASGADDPELVTARSPRWKHAEMYARAVAFKREKHYDFVQWQSPRGDDDPMVHGYLFIDQRGVIQGAAAFRWREPAAPALPFWGLQWVWVAPPCRRQGVLAERWRNLRDRFGAFLVEGPVSVSMEAFLIKHGDVDLMEWPSKRARSGGEPQKATRRAGQQQENLN